MPSNVSSGDREQPIESDDAADGDTGCLLQLPTERCRPDDWTGASWRDVGRESKLFSHQADPQRMVGIADHQHRLCLLYTSDAADE